MSLSQWFNNKKDKLEEAKIKSGYAQHEKMVNLFDKMLESKISNFKKKGIPLTEDRLIQGSSALQKLGLSEQEMRERIRERLSK